MPSQLITLTKPVPEQQSTELAKRVYYVSPEIDDFRLVLEGGQVTAVELVTSGAAEADDLGRKIDLIVAKDILPQIGVDTTVTWRSPHAPQVREGVFAELEAAGVVVRMGEGLYATGELFTDTMDRLDHRLRDIAVRDFGAQNYRYPSLVSTGTLQRAGYLDAFPQFLMTASRCRSDVDSYESFVSGLPDLASASEARRHIGRHSEHLGYCLPPAACYHVYQHLGDRELTGGPTAVTIRGKTFRFESKYHRSMERLWDFTMREVVFLADRDTVVEQRRRMMSAACDLVTELGLAGRLEVANDPFFCNDRTAERVLTQRVMELKYELCLPVEDGRSVAAGSFNAHGEKFGSAFAITLPGGGTVNTACVGFGLERLTYAYFCQHGADPADWPQAARTVLGH
jgi:seryl-tRNA synthetase